MLLLGREGIGRTNVAVIEVYFLKRVRELEPTISQGWIGNDAYGPRIRRNDSTAPFRVRAHCGGVSTRLRVRRVDVDIDVGGFKFGGRTLEEAQSSEERYELGDEGERKHDDSEGGRRRSYSRWDVLDGRRS